MKNGLLSLALLSLISAPAFARSEGDIVTGGTNAALQFTKDAQDDYTGRLNVDLGYDHIWKKGFAFGGDVGISYGSNYKSYEFKVGPTYNFQPNDIENS